MPFDDEDDDKSLKNKPGVKLNNEKSMFAKTEKAAEARRNFEEEANKRINNQNDYKERAWDLAKKFRSILNDTTLEKNKDSIYIDIEKEILAKLIQLAIDMNLDQEEEEGMGSIGLITLLLKCLLIQRDKINDLAFKVDQLEKKLKP